MNAASVEDAMKEASEFEEKRKEMRASVQAKELIDAEVSSEMREAYLNYAMSVIVARALPSAEDGLKPVHRRILWGMNEMGVFHNKRRSLVVLLGMLWVSIIHMAMLLFTMLWLEWRKIGV